jgi:hypothetical protein
MVSVTQRVRIPARAKTVQRFLIQGKPTEVQANDGTVPETQASVHITKLGGDAGGPSSAQPSALQPKISRSIGLEAALEGPGAPSFRRDEWFSP